MSMRLFEMKQEREEHLARCERIIAQAEKDQRPFTPEEQTLLEQSKAIASKLNPLIEAIQERNTLAPGFFGLGWAGDRPTGPTVTVPNEDPASEAAKGKAAAYRKEFASWMSNALFSLGGVPPSMEATAPTGTISIGTGSGLDSIATTMPTEILPYVSSFFALDSFGQAGSSLISTDHTRPLFQPVLAAGAADSVYAENTAPGTSQPFGLSGFTFGGTKYSRLVLATYESLMNSELPLQGTILDELLSSLASTLTTATTTLLNTALTAASSTLEVGTGGSNDIYSSLIELRHAIPPRFDLPSNKWMLSRATLATIRNKRATGSGVAMFDPNTNQILGADFVVNDNFDSICGAGFVVFGSWKDGCYLRRTPVQTRVMQELYAGQGQVGFRTTAWADAHFLAELAGAAQPPSFQPLYYTSIASDS